MWLQRFLPAKAEPMAKARQKAERRTLTIRNRKGLHARASAKFVECAGRFDCEITVSRDGISVPGTSIMGLMMLAAGPGSEILVEATGPDAKRALAALGDLVDDGFGEESAAK